MTNQHILITGGAGSIGSELTRQLYRDNTVFIFDNNETALFDLVEELGIQGRIGDIRDPQALASIIDTFGYPDIVFHSAALKHVTPSMQTPREYVQTNIVGTLNLLEIFAKNSLFINISSDKATQTENVMGWTKRGTELFTRIYGGISVRFGNVLGSRGSVIPIWQKQIDEGRPITVTDPRMERYFMTIKDAVSLVIKAATSGKPGDIYILDMEQNRVNVLALAKDIINKTGRDIPINIIGSRPGEALSEHLMTPHEKENAIKEKDFYILRR